MNAFIMVRERLLFRSSPDKGRAGGVCRAKISFLHDFPPQTPSIPPYQGGSGQIRGRQKINPIFAGLSWV
jgi:hypothetical protein